MTVSFERRPAVAGELRHVDKWYAGNQILHDVSLQVGHGKIVALVGQSGSGKSTLLRVFAGLPGHHTGERVVDGTSAVAFQEPRLFPWRKAEEQLDVRGLAARTHKYSFGIAPEGALADPRRTTASAGQIPAAPHFSDWVDRRFDDTPLPKGSS